MAPSTQAGWVQEEMSLSMTLTPVDTLTVEDSLEVIMRGPDGEVKGPIDSGQTGDSAQNPPFERGPDG